MKPTIRFLLLLLAWTALGRTVAWGQVCATPGRDGSTFSATPNTYYPGVTAAAGTATLSVGAARTGTGAGATAIAQNDLLLVIQMQGATIDNSNSNTYGTVSNTNYTAGQYEYVVADGPITSGSVALKTNLVNTYTTSTTTSTGTSVLRRFQVVRVPQYTSLTLTATIVPAAWDGSTGGITAIDVVANLNFNGFTINASGLGFRGGAGIKVSYSATTTPNTQNAGDTRYLTVANATRSLTLNSMKGEGTAGTPRYVNAEGSTGYFDTTVDGYSGGSAARGAPGNAGGGGNDNGNNSGGGGGANGGAGGTGGKSSANAVIGGVAGAAFSPVSSSRLVMGGGGGAGSTNDGTGNAALDGFASSGAPGGGIVLVRTGTVSGSGGISANGATPATGVRNDGAGGGGAGGSILLTATGSQSGLAGLTMSATGGAGGVTRPVDAANGSTDHGPGGGGGGGVVFTTGATATTLAVSTAAGANGTSTAGNASTTNAFGATAGTAGSGASNAATSNTIANSTAGANCIADVSTTITAASSVNVGQTVSVQATFSNAGPLAAAGTARTVTLPAGATVISATGGTISVASGVTTVTYPAATLSSGATATFTINYVPTAATANTTITVNSAITTTTAEGGLTANNSASAGTAVTSIGAAGTPAPCATPGKDGTVTLSTTASPNTYYPSNGAQSLAVGATSISLGTATGAGTAIAAGDLLLVIQMQGATIDNSNSSTYGTVSTTNYTAGQYEYVVANGSLPASGGTLSLRTGLVNAYTSAVATASAGQRSFQVVRVPQYANLTLTSNIAATPWNGSSGGIIALDVANQTSLGSKTIDASGAGFRGGGGRMLTGIGTATGYAANDWRNLAGTSPTGTGGTKGEGTAGTPRYVSSGSALVDTRTSTNGLPSNLTDGYPGGDNDRGAPGNAGGGGTDTTPNNNFENSGGGGGANGGNGGRGGNAWNSGSVVGGEPGAAFALASTSRLVLGGGGGSGSTNDGTGDTAKDGFASSGAAGGGIVILRTGTLVATSGSAITANGASASTGVANDGSGGGGAGGSILITTANGGLGNLALSVIGGMGGSNTPGGTITAHGPGGGGGGGIVLTNASAASTALTAGTNGTTTVTANGSTTSVPYGAAPGVAGISNAQISTRIANSTAGANCAADVTVSLAGPTTLNAGQPTGNFTATFTNEGPSIATNVTRTITLPAGATLTTNQLVTIQTSGYPNATYDDNTKVLNFGNLASLASDASNVVPFAFTAPAATGSSTLTGNTGPGTNGTSEGINFAPNQATLALNTITTADVKAAITASATATTGTFNVSFSNVGSQTAAGVVRTVQLPTGLTGVTVTGGNDAGSYNSTTGVVTYTTSPTTIAAGSALTSTISYPLTSSVVPVAATATVSTTTNEAGLRDNNTATAVMPATYDLATTLTGPTNTIAGSPTVLYVTTSNNGPNSAPVASQTVIIPSETALTNVYITNGGTYTYNTTDKAGTVTFPNVNNLPSGASVTNSISFAVPVNDASPTNSSAPSAIVAVMTGETSTTNNTAYLNGSTTSTAITVLGSTTTSNNLITKANEQTTIVASAAVVDAGTVVTYTVKATNAGSSGTTSVSNVVQKVQLLPGLASFEGNTAGTTLTVDGVGGTLSGDVITFNAPGGTTTYNTKTGVLIYPTITSQTSGTTQTFDVLAVTVPANVGNNGQLLATASVSTASNDPMPSDNTSSVVVKVKTTADLTATIAGPTTTTAGQKVSYAATFSNKGLGTATSVVETVQLPIGLTNVVVQDPSGNVINNAYNANTGLVVLNVPSNASGTSQVYGISFAAPGQAYVVSSSISSGTPDNVVTNNASVLSTTVSPTADVAIYVSGPATAVAGNAVTYAVTATNNGPNVASTVTPTLQLPAGLTGAGPVATNPDNSSNNGVTVTGGGYYNATTGLVTFSTNNLVSGDSRVGLVTFTMPNSPTNGLVTGAATYSFGGTTPSVDVVSSNNTAALTTAIAPATQELADLVTAISAPTSPTTAGSSISYTLSFSNRSTTTAAIKVTPVAYLPAGLTGVVIKDANGAVVPTAVYNSTTGQVTFPTIDSQAPGNTTSYTIGLNAPANDVVVSASAVSSNTSDPDPSNNIIVNTLTITPSYDVVTKLTGPTSATPGSTNTYTVTTTNNGPSTSPTTANTTQTVTLSTKPASADVTGLPATASYDSNTGIITFAAVNGQGTGANGAVTNTFMVKMPATGTLPLQANVTLTGESNTSNNQDTLTTRRFNQAPVAQNVWNTLRSARGNTANIGAPTGLPISSLLATDDGTVSSYTVVNIPSPAQGVLYFGGSPVLSGQTVTASGLSFAPTAGFVGNATFTYTATDNAKAVSNVALYTIPVAQDRDAQYTNYNNNQLGNTYTVGTVLAQIVDLNAAVYSNAGIIYDNNGVLQSGAANGLPTTGVNATLTSGTLPAGVSLDPATGRLYVSGPLANSNTAQTYNLTVTTTDLNGGTTIVPVSFTIGANPLPVVLTAFTAQAVANRDALLNWATASEQHNDHFDIERSLDGRTFATIGSLAGHGTTAAASTYSLTDANVARLASGPVYYRLKQVDTDGTATFSPLRVVSFTQDLAPVSLRVFPNPVATLTYLDLSQLPAAATVQAQLLDATGRTSLRWSLAAGLPQPLDLTSLASGSYLLLLTGTQPDGSTLHQTLRITKE